MNLLGNISKFGALAVVEKSIAFVFVPRLINVYGLERTGEYFLYIATLNVLIILGKFGQDAFVTVNVQKLDHTIFAKYFEQSKAYVLRRSLVVALLTLIIGGFLGFNFVEITTLGVATIGGSLLQLELNRCHGGNEINKYFARTILVSIIKYGVSLFLLIFIKFDFYWIYLFYALAPWASLVCFRVIRFKSNLLRLDISMINHKNAVNALIQQFSNVGLNSSVKFIIGWKLSTAVLGGYGAVESFSVVMGVFGDSVYKSWLPTYFKSLKKGSYQNRGELMVIVLVATFFLIFSFSSKTILGLIYPDERGINSQLVYLFALYYFMNFLYRLRSAYYYYSESVGSVVRAVILGSAVSLSIMILLINTMGAYGVMLSLIFGQLFMILYLKRNKIE